VTKVMFDAAYAEVESTNLHEQSGAWIDLAFRLADDTDLDFTGGRRLRSATLT